MKYLVLILLAIGCTTTPPQKTKPFKMESHSIALPEEFFKPLSKILSGELLYIQKIEPVEFQKELFKTLGSLALINYQPNNCSQGQVACAFKDHPGTIFINKNFFQLSELEQFTSLLHEAGHHEQKNYEHVKCVKHPEWGYECDENLNSSYGLEYKYLLHKYINAKDEQSAQLIKKIFSRINKI